MSQQVVPAGFTVRPAGPEDRERIAAFARRLAHQTLRLRFMVAIAEDAAAAELEREACCSEPAGETFVAETPDGQTIGHAFAARIDRDEVEVAFVVADPWQHHGVGTALFRALLERMEAEGVHAVSAETLADNVPMIRLLRGTGLPARLEQDRGTLRVHLQLSH